MFSAFLIAVATLSAEPTEAQLPLLKTFREEFIAITPGEEKFPKTFVMGAMDGAEDQRPAREVTFDTPFQVAKYEVPQNLWEAVIGENPSKWKGKRNSVEMLTWDDANKFCAKATELMRAGKLIGEDEVIRLPSEAEWEYVARAGTDSAYSFGDDPAKLDDFGWHTGNAAGNDPPVGAKKPNAWGLYDVHGYLWEWCADPWHDNYKDAPKTSAAWEMGDEKQRVARGGSWKDKADQCTSRWRQKLPADTRDDAVGLRCVLSKGK